MSSADVTNRQYNRPTEVAQVLIYLLAKILLFQWEGQERVNKVCDVTVNHNTGREVSKKQAAGVSVQKQNRPKFKVM